MIDITLDQIKIEVTDLALKQLSNIRQNDYTLNELCFRLKIKGKECHGFTYDLGFTASDKDDLIYAIGEHEIHLDPFTAFYCTEGVLEYLFDIDSNKEGFFFTNKNEKNYRGKFFKNTELEPKFIEQNL